MSLPSDPTTRLERLQALRAAIDAEIAHEIQARRRQAELQQRARQILAGPREPIRKRDEWSVRIIQCAAATFDTTYDEVVSDTRTRNVVNARHAAAWLMRRASRSYPEIAAALKQKDHTSAMHGAKRIDKDAELLAVATKIHREMTQGEAA